jgi:RNA polymerase sigma-70 factor (ECF subfamily)
MPESAASAARDVVERIYREHSRQVLATLIRLLRDFDRAEEALQMAFTAALEHWPSEGIPANPRAWLVSAGRFRTIDALRRRARFDATVARMADEIAQSVEHPASLDDPPAIEDDRLRLIFTCCHPALAPDARIALTLRDVCGLTTEEIARAFLTRPATLAQRIVRAKAKIRDAGIPYAVPGPDELPQRLDSVLHVVYLVFNEGYSASFGDALTRTDLSGEAIRLGRVIVELLPHPEATGLLALMLLHESRRDARTSAGGEIVLLDEQDRTKWDRGLIAEGVALVERALGSPGFGSYALQAAISALHAEAPDAARTDWAQIAALYDVLVQIEPTPVVALNRAVAIGMRDGAAAGLSLIDDLLEGDALVEYRLAHAARADFLRRLGRRQASADAYRRALALTSQGPERRFIERRLRELDG